VAVYKAYFLFNLAEGKTIAEYERWSLAVNHPAARRVKSILGFHDLKVVGALEAGKPAYQVIEDILITDIDAYKAEIAGPEMAGFASEWASWVSDWICILTEQIA
jgi:hypothetical protein